MKRFTKTDVTRKFSEVARAAFGGPVIITQNGKDSHVVMTYEDYEKLVGELHDSTPRKGAPTPERD